ncbi:MAG: redoxin domain-containing protein [bacterium]|nr:redoxin domain-containing protein [bacterium]
MIVPIGKSAPQFSLPLITGATVNLHNLLKSDPLLLLFFKVNCPTCQYSVSFVERLYGMGVPVYGVCQTLDNRQIHSFVQTYQTSFPILVEQPGYDVSNAYGIEVVPTVFLLNSVGIVVAGFEAFDKAGFLTLAKLCGKTSPFRSPESIPVYKAG